MIRRITRGKQKTKKANKKMARRGRVARNKDLDDLSIATANATAKLLSDHPRHKDSREHVELLVAMKNAKIGPEEEKKPEEPEDASTETADDEEADEGAGHEHREGM